MDLQVKYYLGKYDTALQVFAWTELERTENTDTIRYRRCTGLEDKGKPKNIYTETYADSDIVRADYPDTLTREATSITLDIVIMRKKSPDPAERVQTATYDNLYSYFADGPTVFWDTQRRRMAVMHFSDASSPVKDTYLGTPYMECEFKFTNLAGSCPIVNDTFANGHLPLVEDAAKLLLDVSLA